MRHTMWLRAGSLALLLIACAPGPRTGRGDSAFAVEDRTGAELQADLTDGRVTSVELVGAYLARITALDRGGPTLRSVLAISAEAAGEARKLDEERADERVRGPLHGLPVLIKDNIESAGALPTTAGSLALEKNVTGRDAPVVARLRAAGAIILGKTNLSEWANFRSTHSTSGWSALGGLTKNPYALDRNPCGSSSGSAVAVAASLAAMAIGTETDGSVTCPAAVNGLVGFKPTVGLVSRRHIVPISSMQDTAGPMTRTVADAAALLTVMAGTDAGDSATADADAHRTDYSAALSPRALAGARFGIMKFSMGYLPALDAVFDAAVAELRAAGAEVVDIEAFDGLDRISRTELQVLLTDFRIELNAYLAADPAPIPVRTLREVIAFNKAQAARELPHFGQELFDEAERTAGTDAAAHEVRRDGNRRAAGPEGIDRLLATYKVDALIAPSTGPAWVTDLLNGDHILGSAMTLAAVAGYPHLTVPMGQVGGLPVGLSFVGSAWSDARLLAFGFAYEQRTHARRPPALVAATPQR